MSAATVTHHRARSGNPDGDYFQPTCGACGWKGAMYSNRTVEGRTLAAKHASEHRCEPTPDQSYCEVSRHQQCTGYTEDEADPGTCMCECHVENMTI